MLRNLWNPQPGTEPRPWTVKAQGANCRPADPKDISFFFAIHFTVFHSCFFFYLTNCRFVAILHLTSVCSNSICSLYVSMSHFDDSHNVLSFFIIIIFVMMICDQGSLMLLSTIVWGTINYTHLRQ